MSLCLQPLLPLYQDPSVSMPAFGFANEARSHTVERVKAWETSTPLASALAIWILFRARQSLGR